MPTLTWEQAVRDARAAGFSGPDLVIITAIAYAESRLQSNPPGNSNHYGILQFDAPTARQAGGYTAADVLNPQKAFKAAHNLVYGQNGAPKRGFQPWQGDGWQNFLALAENAVHGSGGVSVPGGGIDIGGLGSAAGSGLGQFLPPGVQGGIQAGASGIQDLASIPSSLKNLATAITNGPAAMGAAVGNSLMDAGRSFLPYLVILGIILFGAILVLSGMKGEVARTAMQGAP